MQPFVGPEVVPIRTRRQVDAARGCTLFRYRRDQQRGSEHVLISKVCHLRIAAEIEEQPAHKRLARLVRVPAQRVEIGQERIAQPKVLFQDRLGLPAVAPNLIPRTRAVRPHVGLKGSVLKPARV